MGASAEPFWYVPLDRDIYARVAFRRELKFGLSDFAALAEAKIEAEKWLASSVSKVERQAALTMLFNVVRLQRGAADWALTLDGVAFASSDDEATFRAWAESIVLRCAEASDACDVGWAEFPTQEDVKGVVGVVEERSAPLFAKVAPLHAMVTQGMPPAW